MGKANRKKSAGRDSARANAGPPPIVSSSEPTPPAVSAVASDSEPVHAPTHPISSIEIIVGQETLAVHGESTPASGLVLADMPTDAVDPRERSGLLEAIETRETPGRIPVIAGYRIIRILATGGMGTVFEAEQNNPRRRVALKIIRADLGNPDVYRRFEHEANILGLLQHPGIAQIFEAGTFDLGDGPQPYIAMEFVQGRPLMQHLSRENPALRGRLELLAQVCEAVQHAHQKRVIHRDLKPDNILVDGLGQPKIVDFGVARAYEVDNTTANATRAGIIIGTINYMSPEQIEGKSDDVDTRSDIYSLGVIGYQLLAGRLPHDMMNMTLSQAARKVREAEPPPLSTIDRALRGDVETIIAKALRKKPEQRYQAASDMAADIRHFLNDEPIIARPPSAIYNLRKFAKRNRPVVFAAAGLFSVLCASLISSSFQAQLAKSDRIAAQQAEAQSERTRRDAQRLRFESEQARTKEAEARQQAERERLRADQEAAKARAEAANAQRVSEVLMDLLALSNPGPETSVVASPRELLDSALSRITESLESDPKIQGRLVGVIAEAYRNLGIYEQAVAAFDRQIEILKRVPETGGPDVIDAIASRGEALGLAGRGAEAEAAMSEAFELARARKPKDNAQIERIMGKFAGVLSRRALVENPKENLQKSEMLYRHLLAMVKMRGGGEDLAYASALSDLAGVFRRQGRKDQEVEKFFRQALEIRQRLEDHPSLASAAVMTSLAELLQANGDKEEAGQLYEKAYQTCAAQLGMDHGETARALFVYADFLCTVRRQLDRAVPLYRRAVELTRRVLGPDAPELADRGRAFAQALWQTGENEEWPELMRESLDIMLKARMGEDPQFAELADAYVKRLLMRGKKDEATRFTTELLESRKRDYGEAHPLYGQALLLQAQVAYAKGDHERSTALKDQAAHVRRLSANAP